MPAEAAASVYVLDACAVIAFLYAEEGADVVEEILHQYPGRCALHAINACEVYYDLLLRGDDDEAGTLEAILAKSGIELNSDLSVVLWKLVGKLKARWRRVSLADCFALALTIRKEATLATSDHHEFDRLAREGVCPIRFIR